MRSYLPASQKIPSLDKSLLGAGWGTDYEQTPSKKYSTCMSSEKGPSLWRFQNCEMLGSDTCKKSKPPPEYDTSKCKKYFDQSGFNMDQKGTSHSPNDLGLSPKSVAFDVMYIKNKDEYGNKVIERTCFQPKNLREYGWCHLEGHPITTGERPWGICSPSCSTDASQACIS